MSETETPDVPETIVAKPSKLKRIKSTAVVGAWIIIPVAAVGASMYYSGRLTQMQLEAAKLTLEAAKLSAKA